MFFFRQGSVDRPKGVDPADILDQGEPRTRPLYIDPALDPTMKPFLAKTMALNYPENLAGRRIVAWRQGDTFPVL